MGLDLLQHEIINGAHKKAEAIDAEATAKMHEIVRAAHVQAKATEEAAMAEAKAFTEAERSERLSAARLESGRMLSEAREMAVNAALEKVWAEFAKRRNSHGYKAELAELVRKAASELGHPNPHVLLNAQDKKLLAGSKWKISSQALDCVGGAVVETPDGRIRVDATFEEIFARAKEAVRKEIYARMGDGSDMQPEEHTAPKRAKKAKPTGAKGKKKKRR